MYDVFFNTPNVVNEINNIAKINLTKVRKGVNNMLDAKKLAENERAEGIQEGLLMAACSMLRASKQNGKDLTENPDRTIKSLIKTIGISKELAEEAYNTVCRE